MSSKTKLGVLLSFFALVISLFVVRPAETGTRSEPDSQARFVPVGYIAVPTNPVPEGRVNTPPPALALERLKPLLVSKPGAAYGKASVVKHSRYLAPVRDHDGLRGRSRRWGDADLSVQAECVTRLVHRLRAAEFSESEIAFALALWRCESGFNPDAAAGSSSACGLGQFLDRTRAVLCARAGIANSDPFGVDLNVACTHEALKEALRFAAKRARPGTLHYFEYAYAYHHDGPSLDSGGLEIARTKVIPWLETAKRCISE